MTDGQDILAGEVSLEASLTDNGLKAAAKSRFVSSLDRLLGGIIDLPSSFVEGRAARRRLADSLFLQQSQQRGELLNKFDYDVAALEATVILAHKKQEADRWLNKADVLVEALEDLRNKPQADFDKSVAEDVIEDDWLNVFGGYAEKASSDRLQNLWGRILSGEIRKPGSFSLTTLRVLSEIDQNIATAFQDRVKAILEGKFLISTHGFDGEDLMELTGLEDAGLLQGVAGTISLTQQFNAAGIYLLINGNHALVATGPADQTITIPAVTITRAGREVLGILPPIDTTIMLRVIASIIGVAAVKIDLVEITGRTGDVIHHRLVEKIK